MLSARPKFHLLNTLVLPVFPQLRPESHRKIALSSNEYHNIYGVDFIETGNLIGIQTIYSRHNLSSIERIDINHNHRSQRVNCRASVHKFYSKLFLNLHLKCKENLKRYLQFSALNKAPTYNWFDKYYSNRTRSLIVGPGLECNA